MGSSLAAAEQCYCQQVLAVKMQIQKGETGCWSMTINLRSGVPAGSASLMRSALRGSGRGNKRGWGGSIRCCTASCTKTEQYGDGYLAQIGSTIEMQRRL